MIPARGASVLSLLPGLLLALLSFWFGTLPGGATSGGSAVGCAALLWLALIGAPDWPDPLRLGRRLGIFLPLALVATAIISWYLSPVSRAGMVGTLLLPAFLLAPAGVARCWRQPRQFQNGGDTVSLAVLVMAGWSLVEWYRLESPRAAMPLGHHNLLAGWLVFLLPVAAVGLHRPGVRRWLAAAALTIGSGAILATGSLLGMAALTLQGMLAACWWPALRLPFATATGLAALSQVPRGLRILTASDLSSQARALYLRAAWDGLAERPAWGWGPGSTPWLIARFLEPDPAVNPPSQVVGDFHSLPAQLAFEVGMVGLVLGSGLWLLFIVRRWPQRGKATSTPEQQACFLGLAGGALYLLGNAPVAVLALPAAAVIATGAALAADFETVRRGSRQRLLFTLLYLLPVGALLLPKLLAQVHYDRAATNESPAHALEEIEWARSLDPAFPLYGARTAWLRGSLYGADRESARLALQAAEAAEGIAPLWLAAGFMGLEASAGWTVEALSTARDLDPLSPLPPFLMAVSQPDHPEAGLWAAQALRLEPRLSQTSILLERNDLQRRAIEALRASGFNTDPIVRLESDRRSGVPGAALGLSVDRTPALAFSLYAFRRRPWPATLVRLPLRQ